MVGLDTFLTALYTHLVKPGKLNWADVVRACSSAPVKIVNPYDREEDVPVVAPLLLFAPEEQQVVTCESLCCGTTNNPMLNSTLYGGVTLPINR
jgi:dihydroorotase